MISSGVIVIERSCCVSILFIERPTASSTIWLISDTVGVACPIVDVRIANWSFKYWNNSAFSSANCWRRSVEVLGVVVVRIARNNSLSGSWVVGAANGALGVVVGVGVAVVSSVVVEVVFGAQLV